MNLFPFLPGYESAIYQTGREPAFIMMLAFIITHIFTRGYTRLARKAGWGSAKFGGVHTHHMVFGLVIAFTSSALMFSFLPSEGLFLLILAAAFGSGASLVLDEFALMFHLEDVYWEEEGRKSIDAVVLGAALGGVFLMRITPFASGTDVTGWLLFSLVAVNIGFAIIAALKGKILSALFGIFIPLIAPIGSIRLAEPDSVWANKIYSKRSDKMMRSQERYGIARRKWAKRKAQIWDLIGGKTGR